MTLERKREPEIVPEYSLTGDLLSFMKCGLQYRYHSGSALPPSRPVQVWFGEFVHGVMEAAYRIWQANPTLQFPWPSTMTQYLQPPPAGRAMHDIGTIGDTVEVTLKGQGKLPRSRLARDSAYARATSSVNELGPHLFPLVSSAEERVIGTRPLPQPSGGAIARGRLYELHGIIDVLSSVTLSAVKTPNVICQAIQDACPTLGGKYEVIVDYKGTYRPSLGSDEWNQGDWQVQTYAWLRTRQANALPVAAGVLLYVNELSMGETGVQEFQRAAKSGKTDVIPLPGSPDAYKLSTWTKGSAVPDFSLDFRLKRAIRVIPIDDGSQNAAVAQFDTVVGAIEQCVAAEAAVGRIAPNWKTKGDAATCVACDFRHFCPSPHGAQTSGGKPYTPPAPTAP